MSALKYCQGSTFADLYPWEHTDRSVWSVEGREMDDKTKEFMQSVVETDLDRLIIEVLSDQSMSYDDKIKFLLSKMGDVDA